MSDVNEWINERRRIHDAATEDAARVLWEHDDPEGESPNENFEDEPKWERERLKQAAQAVLESSDAHNTLPNLLTAVEKVLEVISKIDREYSKAPVKNAYADGMCDAAYMFDTALSEAIEGASDE